MFGPDSLGAFKEVIVKGIHENRVSVDHAFENSAVTIKIKAAKDPIKEQHIRKGSCLINVLPSIKGANPYEQVCSKFFTARVQIKHHHTTI